MSKSFRKKKPKRFQLSEMEVLAGCVLILASVVYRMCVVLCLPKESKDVCMKESHDVMEKIQARINVKRFWRKEKQS